MLALLSFRSTNLSTVWQQPKPILVLVPTSPVSLHPAAPGRASGTDLGSLQINLRLP